MLPSLFDPDFRIRAALPFYFFFCSFPLSFPLRRKNAQHLSLGAPDVLQQTVTLGEAVHGVVRLAHSTDESAQSVDVVLSGDEAAALVNLGDGDLDGTVVLGLDDAVGGRALAGDVAAKDIIFVSHSFEKA